jgi:hypothetical protein
VREGTTESFANVAESLSRRCGSRLLSLTPGNDGVEILSGYKHVVCIEMPPLKGIGSRRKNAMAQQGIPWPFKSENIGLTCIVESRLSVELDTISSLFPKYLVVFSGFPSHLFARQDPSEYDPPPPSLLNSVSGGNTTVLQDGGVLKRYQILTPALITSLIITLFVLVPVIMLGVSALASIQSPLSSEVPKGFDAQEKKVQ